MAITLGQPAGQATRTTRHLDGRIGEGVPSDLSSTEVAVVREVHGALGVGVRLRSQSHRAG